VAPLTLAKVHVADITLRDVPAIAAERGALSVNLLGMILLGRPKRFQMSGRELVLVQ
jgi:predicted aspartyl protease